MNFNRRVGAAGLIALLILLILAIYIAGGLTPASALNPDFSRKGLPPSGKHLFGTDYLGRDMFTRTVKGLSLSLRVGAAASWVSAVIALIVGTTAAFGKRWVDQAINWVIDVFMSVPHTVLLILISLALNRGAAGLFIGVAVTHWCNLARIIRGEVLQLRSKVYITASRKFGKSSFWIARNHILPHLLPQFLVGLILLFPHAIMHESGLTFLGFGLPPEQPAVGIILSESMRYLSSGAWWLAFFPGLSLAVLVLLLDKLGSTLRYLLSPKEGQK
ncbi:MAG: ABC transporter permease [Spirochaetaceae bacterium]|jgi:peptide/nickel transport system permease protein|nr:ABC transporter permease [Spirochaetaceae bacterium]